MAAPEERSGIYPTASGPALGTCSFFVKCGPQVRSHVSSYLHTRPNLLVAQHNNPQKSWARFEMLAGREVSSGPASVRRFLLKRFSLTTILPSLAKFRRSMARPPRKTPHCVMGFSIVSSGPGERFQTVTTRRPGPEGFETESNQFRGFR